MSLIKVAPDKSYLISEERLRFAVPADLEPWRVPIALMLSRELPKSIEIYEKHRGWKMLDVVPSRKEFPFGRPCCLDIIEKKPGETLGLKFFHAEFQGDTDDAHNFDEVSDPNKRLYEDGLIDWICLVHFWVPAVDINVSAHREASKSLGYREGFTPFQDLPEGLQKVLNQRKLHADS